jgi:D-alanine-D-alanine ligase
MRIGLIYNLRPTGLDRNDPVLEKFIEGDEWKTIEAIGNAIKACGHTLEYFEIHGDIYELLKEAKPKIDLFFNLSEGISNGADREAQIPMLCEILGLKYTGPTPLTAALILNKSRAKEIWKANGVQTANWQLITKSGTKLNKDLSFPVIVKPNSEGSGIGIKSNSIVQSQKELDQAVTYLLTEYGQAALVEQYLPGREFTVALIGNNESLITLPIVEINFDSFPKDAPRVDTYEAKFVYGVTGEADATQTEFCPAKVAKGLEEEINNLAKQAFTSIGAYDFARVDLRMDDKGKVYVMEINHPPGMMSDPNESSFFTIAARSYGWTFEKMIEQILDAAINRLAVRPN